MTVERRITYPFCAIVGQERMKKALILNAINPSIGGVLIVGEKGTAKSSAIRALASLLPEIEVVTNCPYACSPYKPEDMCEGCYRRWTGGEELPTSRRKVKIVDLPLNATEDRLIGTLDLKEAVQNGVRSFEPGLLAEANRGILYVDEVNLLDDYLVGVLLDVAISGINVVEREGISYRHPARFALVGTMNPEEGDLRPQILDRFGLSVEVGGITDPEERVEVLRRRAAFEKDPFGFRALWTEKENELRARILKAQQLLPEVTVPPALVELAVKFSLGARVSGHRADVTIVKTAMTIAAYHGRTEVEAEDIKEAAELVLAHRHRAADPRKEQDRQTSGSGEEKDEREDGEGREDKSPSPEQSNEGPEDSDGSSDDFLSPQPFDASLSQDEEEQKEEENGEPPPGIDVPQREGIIYGIGEIYRVREVSPPADRILRRGTGRRTKTRTGTKVGRYVRSVIPRNTVTDVALDATLRAAAPYQPRREKAGRAIAIESMDIREKVREKKIGNTILFLVDASGSMGAQQRMVAAKGAVLSLLVDAYQRRDKVGLVAFRGNKAEILLSPTRSVELAHRKLAELPTGGKTPMALGLAVAFNVLHAQMAKEEGTIPLLVLISDGKANVGFEGMDPVESAKLVAEEIYHAGINSIVIDTEKEFISFGLSREICTVLGGWYIKLEELRADNIRRVVQNSLPQ